MNATFLPIGFVRKVLLAWAAAGLAAAATAGPPRGCASLEFTPAQRFWIQQDLLVRLPMAAPRLSPPRVAEWAGAIPVVFHVITDGDQGLVHRDRIDRQIVILNEAFAPIRFELAEVIYVDNPWWFRMFPLLSWSEWSCKGTLQWDPGTYLNIYTCLPLGDLLGWAYFPFMAPFLPSLDGVVVHHGSLPGGDVAPYHLGDTLVHEVGHWAGLFHTFQGFCGGFGDWVEDTPAELTASRGCDIGRDSCPKQAGLDPIHNYMDYSDDDCADEFTPGQFERMLLHLQVYRPTIWHRLVYGD